MTKVLSVTVKNIVGSSNEYKHREFTELNELLSDGWVIIRTETVNSSTASVFSIIYILDK
jgi:hypothetical protein